MDEENENTQITEQKNDDAENGELKTTTTHLPIVHDTKIGVTITTNTFLIDYAIKQIVILPSTSANITVFINTDRGQKERVLYMGTADYLQWADDAFLYGWISKNVINAL